MVKQFQLEEHKFKYININLYIYKYKNMKQNNIFLIKEIRLNILKYILNNKCKYCNVITKGNSKVCLSCTWTKNNNGIQHMFFLQE